MLYAGDCGEDKGIARRSHPDLASIALHVGIPDRFAYSMSKGAIYATTMSVAKNHLTANLRCNSVSPARVHPPLNAI
ncbi:SDR family oxidoreductase [Rufibacter sp. H-1]|uniref:SDR family oxidoreductase n=1 Tax=Rufibacter sediminis TaxID=2762756 RepID=A0ABR6VP95_9BACT|nr:SDR family oxidoreductase [Rufibacter sediminis]